MRFRKLGGGVHRMTLNGKMVKVRRGEVIDCEKWELGGAIRQFDQLDDDPPPAPLPENVRLTVAPRGGGDLDGWNVMNPETGDPLNNAPLTKEEAEEIAAASATLTIAEIREALTADPGDGAGNPADPECDVVVETNE